MRPIIAKLLQGLKQLNYWLVAQLALAVLTVLRLLPPDKALNFADRAARKVGPWIGRHRVALDNLRKAYPEKTEAEIEAIALDMWGNMARLGAEYIFLDQLFDYVPDVRTDGRIEVSGKETFLKLAAEKDRPHIIFTGHLGNFELLPVAGAAFGLAVTAMFRPPNNPYIAEYVFSTRQSKMGGLLASRAGAAFALARILEAGGNIGVLVDQKFQYGIRTQFFGRECETSPLVPKLAKQYDCDVYPARCIRLPGNRFRLILQERLELPRTGDGQVDVAATAQVLTDIVEGWVREDPGQWMWFHKRWNITPPKPNRAKRAA
ncbi:lipid A biosynthesis lauroyl acyltransferase [Mesorhizobium sp. ZC-5]|uniref:lipid A biosynthesis lauroyl acyltransferase n=1 Tax=Mesorhizobium sp. ZC-5 TaxID=2986066 RepID=UPI0021E815B8|nr:lipid A biosynthesis lauroyl acyltransferase [Mesorhizobium sp. ZC-5]MCV3240859.1 lipid A biosynthesis lauroyl acyltransferase [Mesorhizobium sp. ZC-5]